MFTIDGRKVSLKQMLPQFPFILAIINPILGSQTVEAVRLNPRTDPEVPAGDLVYRYSEGGVYGLWVAHFQGLRRLSEALIDVKGIGQVRALAVHSHRDGSLIIYQPGFGKETFEHLLSVARRLHNADPAPLRLTPEKQRFVEKVLMRSTLDIGLRPNSIGVLRKKDILYLGDLESCSEEDLRAIPMVGDSVISKVKTALAAAELPFGFELEQDVRAEYLRLRNAKK